MATLKLRRGSSFSSPQLGEPFYNTDKDTLQLGIDGSSFVTFTKIDDINTGSLNLTGNISASGDITASNIRVENDIRIGGNIFLGDELANDNINIQASLSGSLIPNSGSEYDLGSDDKKWSNIFVDTASIGELELDGITVLENLTVSGTSSFQTVTELDGTLTEYSQSVENRLSFLEIDSGSQEGRLDNLEIFTSSQETKNTTLENTTSSLEQATSSLESFTSSQEILNPTFATTGSNNFIGDQSITGSLFVSGAIRFDIPAGVNSDIVESDIGNVRINPGFLRTSNATDEPFLTESTRRGGFHDFDSVFVSNKDTGYSTIGFTTNLSRSLDSPSVTIDGLPNEEPGFYASSGSDSFNFYTWLKLQRGDSYTDGRVTFTTPIIASGSLTAPLQEGYYWVGDENGYNEQVPTSSFTDRIDALESDSGSQDSRITDLESTGSNHESRINQLEIDSGSQDNRLDNLEIFTSSQELKNTTLESTTGSLQQTTSSLEIFTSSQESKNTTLATTTGSYESRFETLQSTTSSLLQTTQSLEIFTSSQESKNTTLASVTSSLDQRLDSFEDVSESYARTDLENTFTERQFFADIEVAGTASFARIESTTGSAKIIGDAFILLNNDTPTERYAGIKVLDSGSTNTTASFQYDGQLQNWFYEYSDDGGITSDYGVTLFGPEYNDIESPVYPQNNYILKGLGGHHISSSRITDNGIQVEIETSLNVVNDITGSSFSGQILSTNGVVSGSVLRPNGENVVSGSSQIIITNTTGFSTFSSSIDSRFLPLEDFVNTTYGTDSSSFDSRLNNVEITTSSFDNRLSQLETETGSIEGEQNVQNDRIDNVELTTQSFDLRLDDLEFISESHGDRISQLEIETGSIANEQNAQDSRLSQLETETGSITNEQSVQDGRLDNVELTTQSFDNRIGQLETETSSLNTRIGDLETFSSSLDTEFLNTGGDNVVSGSDQLTSSYDQRYALSSSFQDVSSSYINLIGDYASDISLGNINLGDGAFLNVSSSLTISTPNEVLANAGAIRQYIDESVGAADITSVIVEDGLTGGGTAGDVSMSLDTGSSHFTNGVVQSLPSNLISSSTQLDNLGYLNINGDGVFTSSEQVDVLLTQNFDTFSSSVDSRIDDLESFSSSLEATFVTEIELTSATGALEDSINTKLDTGSYTTDSSSFDSRIDNLESFSSSLDDNFVTQTELASATGALETADTEQQDRLSQLEIETGSIEGEQNVQDGRLTNLELSSGSYDSRFTTLETVTSSIENRLGQLETETGSIVNEQNAQDSRLSQLETETGSITNEQSVQDGRLDNIESFTSSIDTTIKTKLDSDGVISGSDQLTGSLVDLSSDQTIGGTKTFNNIVVNGTGSFAVIESISGEAKIIGDAYIILNNDTPTSRYAGFKVLDSGSAGTTASFEYDGQTNDFFYQYTDDGGVTDEFGIAIFGPEYNTKGSPTYLSNNTIPKGNGGHHLNDSNITDSGTLITLGSNTVIDGTITATGTTLISGSSQVNADNITNFDSNVKTKLDLDGVHSGSNQIVQFSKVGIGTGSDATYELKVAGDIGATGDIVAYISSDRRLKENITPISDPIDKINKISGYTFEWNEDKQHIYKGKDYGVVAQEIQEIFPELVHERESGYLGVKYDKLVSVLIEAVKELSNEVNELKSKLE